MGLKSQCLVAPANVQPRHIKLNSGTYSCGPLGRGRARRLACLELQSNSVSKRIALGLLHLHQNILLRIGSLRILHGRIHLAEDPQIVEPGLRVEQILLAQRFALVHLQFALYDVVARMFGSGHHHRFTVKRSPS